MGLENLYFAVVGAFRRGARNLVPYLRRTLRFFALPYCYVWLVHWDECKASRWQVAKDFLYIFFILKMFPDNYSICRLWDRDRAEWKYLYGSAYDAYQRQKLRRRVQRPEYQILFQDKLVCRKLCQAAGFPLPRLLGVAGCHQDLLTIVERGLRDEYSRLIFKPIRGKGGGGVGVVFRRGSQILVSASGHESPMTEALFPGTSIVEEYLQQHPSLDSFAPSVNTIRILTLMTEQGDPLVLCATARFGRGKSPIDNMSLGGLGVGVEIESGRFFERAYDFRSRVYLTHPDSGRPFGGFQLPFWDKVVDLAREIQREFWYYGLLGHDIAIGPEGPVIVEINDSPDTASEEVYEPILLRKRNRVEFRKLDLLPNRLLDVEP